LIGGTVGFLCVLTTILKEYRVSEKIFEKFKCWLCFDSGIEEDYMKPIDQWTYCTCEIGQARKERENDE